MASPEELNTIADHIQLYVGIILYVIGSIGALLNMYILTRKSLRKSSCSFYLFSQSFSDFCWLINALLVRILFYYSIRTYTDNVVYCPFRGYTAFDRCMCTSREINQRRRSSQHLLIVLLHNGTTCTNISPTFIYYINYFTNPILYGILPFGVLTYFGLRTVMNIRSFRQGTRILTRLNHNFIRMLLIQISFTIITTVPITIFSIYYGITYTMNKSANYRAIENLFVLAARLLNNLNYTSAFYMNVIAMPEVRSLIKRHLFCRRNQVVPLSGAPP
ncbi:hypothetical protein I4U23_019965 [Adineta vaga]|nr:hypothetical protein I4U23_019965 [Adineta vaga]